MPPTQAAQRGEALGLTDNEVAFYDALETNDSAVKVLGDEALRTIARELVATVRANVTIDWAVRENVRAHLRVLDRRLRGCDRLARRRTIFARCAPPARQQVGANGRVCSRL